MSTKLKIQVLCLLCVAVQSSLFGRDPGWRLVGFPHIEVEQVILDPMDDYIVYAGLWTEEDITAIYKSFDRGETWIALPVRQKRVSSIVIDPINPNRIYVSFWDDYPIRSEDGGMTWTVMPRGKYWNLTYFTIDPTHTNIIYFILPGSPEGISTLKSTDWGLTWQDISPDQNGWSEPCPVAVNPQNSDIVYTKTYNLFKSTDQGLNWSMINYGFANMDFIFLNQEHPDTVYVADPAIGSYEKGRLLISHDGGINWFEKGPFNGRIEQIISDPTNANVIYFPAGKEIVKSTDAGMTWEKIENGFLNAKIWSIALSHDGHILYAATDSGLFKKDLTTAIEQKPNSVPEGFMSLQNHPNPFNATTTIRFNVPQRSIATLKVYDILGQEVTHLADKEFQPGEHAVLFDATGLASGVYVYRLQAGQSVQQRKLLLLR